MKILVKVDNERKNFNDYVLVTFRIWEECYPWSSKDQRPRDSDHNATYYFVKPTTDKL